LQTPNLNKPFHKNSLFSAFEIEILSAIRNGMSKEYNHAEIEAKWQKYWSEHKIYQAKEDASKPKYYVLDMFPYPSGAGHCK